MSDEPKETPTSPPVSGAVLAIGLVVAAVGALGAACLGWAAIPILIAVLGLEATLLVRWSR